MNAKSACFAALVITVLVNEQANAKGPGDSVDRRLVRVNVVEIARPADPDRFLVITHGLGGTAAGDRFRQLAESIVCTLPNAAVVIVDWTSSIQPGSLGMPNPWAAAKRIDDVATVAAASLQEQRIDPARTTLIGESFGNYVNYGIAAQLGGVERALVFNPASEAGGYPPPKFDCLAERSWSFHTPSVFDTRRDVAGYSLVLTTPVGADAFEQHTFGIRWLTRLVNDGHCDWLDSEPEILDGPEGSFDGRVNEDGSYDAVFIAKAK
jgi:hypothetical protein